MPRRQLAELRYADIVARAAPEAVGVFQRVIGMVWTRGPGRVHEGVMKVLLYVLHALDRGIANVERMELLGRLEHDMPVRGTDGRSHVEEKAPHGFVELVIKSGHAVFLEDNGRSLFSTASGPSEHAPRLAQCPDSTGQ